jgi:uncharacterized membrane protein YhaH (DUF805 family)
MARDVHLVLRVCQCVVIVVVVLVVAKRWRDGMLTRANLAKLAAPCGAFLTTIPWTFDLPIVATVPVFVVAFALLVFALLRAPSSDDRGGPAE